MSASTPGPGGPPGVPRDDMAWVIARERIRDLVTRYNSYGDSGRFEQLEALFAPDASMDIVWGDRTDTYRGRDEVMTIFGSAKGRVDAQRAAARPGYVRHYTATHQIDLVDADHANGRCYFAVILPGGLDHWGRYIDTYERTDGQWRFATRRVHVDGRSGDSWFTD